MTTTSRDSTTATRTTKRRGHLNGRRISQRQGYASLPADHVHRRVGHGRRAGRTGLIGKVGKSVQQEQVPVSRRRAECPRISRTRITRWRSTSGASRSRRRCGRGRPAGAASSSRLGFRVCTPTSAAATARRPRQRSAALDRREGRGRSVSSVDQEYLKHFEPHFDSKLHDSMSPKYRLFRPLVRPVGRQRADGECLHEAAIRRMSHAPSAYAPENLRGCPGR